MFRKTTRLPTAHCTLPAYMGFLLSEPKSPTCCRLAEIMNISHDSANRFLLRETYEAEDLFNEAKGNLNLIGGTLSVDDSVLDKPYSQLWRWSVTFGQANTTKSLKASISSPCTTRMWRETTFRSAIGCTIKRMVKPKMTAFKTC